MQHGSTDMAPSDVEAVLRGHLQSASMLAIFPLQDWVGMDGEVRLADYRSERINEPSNPCHHWRYRFHMELEKLLECKVLNDKMLGMIRGSGR